MKSDEKRITKQKNINIKTFVHQQNRDKKKNQFMKTWYTKLTRRLNRL